MSTASGSHGDRVADPFAWLPLVHPPRVVLDLISFPSERCVGTNSWGGPPYWLREKSDNEQHSWDGSFLKQVISDKNCARMNFSFWMEHEKVEFLGGTACPFLRLR